MRFPQIFSSLQAVVGQYIIKALQAPACGGQAGGCIELASRIILREDEAVIVFVRVAGFFFPWLQTCVIKKGVCHGRTVTQMGILAGVLTNNYPVKPSQWFVTGP